MALLKIPNLISVTLQLFKTRCRKLAQACEPLVSQMAVWGGASGADLSAWLPPVLSAGLVAILTEPLQTLSLEPSLEISQGRCSVSAVNCLRKRSLFKLTPN